MYCSVGSPIDEKMFIDADGKLKIYKFGLYPPLIVQTYKGSINMIAK